MRCISIKWDRWGTVEQKLISIVVPIYGVENELEKCINSLIKQTYPCLEIILVDDGSPDRCPIICEEYAKADQRIVVIHKKNGGLSDARNVGMNKARGEYILFVDSDDYIALDACENLIEIALRYDADIVTGDAMRVNKSEIKILKNFDTKGEIYTGWEYLKQQLRNRRYLICVWVNLYKRKFLIENRLFFKAGIYHEDNDWTPKTFYLASKVISSQHCFYRYIIRDNSITTSPSNLKASEDLMVICKDLVKYFSDIKDIEFKRLFYDDTVRRYFSAFIRNHKYYAKHTEDLDREFPIKNAQRFSTRLWAKLFLFDLQFFSFAWRSRRYIERNWGF